MSFINLTAKDAETAEMMNQVFSAFSARSAVKDL